MPVGRPSKFTPEIEERILAELSSGLSLRKICQADDMPDRVTVIRWISRNPEFATNIAGARVMQGESYADRMVDRAECIVDGEDAQVARVQIAAWQWMASKLQPKVYGDRTTSVQVTVPVDAEKLKALTELPQEDLEAAIALGEKLAAALTK